MGVAIREVDVSEGTQKSHLISIPGWRGSRSRREILGAPASVCVFTRPGSCHRGNSECIGGDDSRE